MVAASSARGVRVGNFFRRGMDFAISHLDFFAQRRRVNGVAKRESGHGGDFFHRRVWPAQVSAAAVAGPAVGGRLRSGLRCCFLRGGGVRWRLLRLLRPARSSPARRRRRGVRPGQHRVRWQVTAHGHAGATGRRRLGGSCIGVASWHLPGSSALSFVAGCSEAARQVPRGLGSAAGVSALAAAGSVVGASSAGVFSAGGGTGFPRADVGARDGITSCFTSE